MTTFQGITITSIYFIKIILNIILPYCLKIILGCVSADVRVKHRGLTEGCKILSSCDFISFSWDVSIEVCHKSVVMTMDVTLLPFISLIAYFNLTLSAQASHTFCLRQGCGGYCQQRLCGCSLCLPKSCFVRNCRNCLI